MVKWENRKEKGIRSAFNNFHICLAGRETSLALPQEDSE